MKKLLVILSIVIITGSLLVAVWYGNKMFTASKPLDSEIVFLVTSGESFPSIASRLEDESIISSSFWFSVYGKLHPELVTGIQAGEYVFDGSVTLEEVFLSLQQGKFERRLTFIEGWRREQMAEYLAEKYDEGFAVEFLGLTENDEGKLFPDTYIVGTITPAEVRELLLSTFDEKFTAEKREKLNAVGLSQEELLNFAAIVEREVILDSDRSMVAGIMLKRWRNDWPLDADATVQYAMASERCQVFTECTWWPKDITFDDLGLDSPFNTRKYVGLPPQPIANPGMSSIDAVLNPTETEYWFYLSDEDGVTRFAETLEEHNQNISTYLNK